MTGISVGDYRDPDRGLELGELMCEPPPRRGQLVDVHRRSCTPTGSAAAPSRITNDG